MLVATIPLANAHAEAERLASQPGAVATKTADGGLVWYRSDRPTTAYLARPALAYLLEIHDPAGDTLELAGSGRIRPVESG